MNSEHRAIKTRFDLLYRHLDEKSKRLFVATEAKALGYGGITIVSELTGVSRAVIAAGIEDLEGPSTGTDKKKRRRTQE